MCLFVATYAQDATAISEELEKTAVQEMKRTGTPE